MLIGITGATGFVGSALACNFLKHGHEILAVSRNDENGERTLAAIEKSWLGFDFPANEFNKDKIKVLSIDFAEPSSIPEELIAAVDVFWHVAADMSYSSKQFLRSFQQNITNTANLHKFIAEKATKIKRFYYVSTAYTSGFDSDEDIAEEIHSAPKVNNVYQALKWTAEITLEKQAKDLDLPTSIFRPSIVVGHSKNGFRSNSEFGLYGFVKAAYLASKNNVKEMCFDIAKSIKLNLIAIDYLADWALKLSERDEKGSDNVEVFHASGSAFITTCQLMDTISKIIGIRILIDSPKTKFDHRINALTKSNAPFALRNWNFETKNLSAVLGNKFEAFEMNKDMLMQIVSSYISEHDSAETNKSHISGLKQVFNKGDETLKLIGINFKKSSKEGISIRIRPDEAKRFFV